MVSVFALWLPILLSAAFVFIVSSVIHMALGYHRSDFGKVPDENGVMDALRRFSIPPGDYVMPWAASAKEMSSPEYVKKTTEGPVAFMTVIQSGPPAMGKSLVLWFVYCLVVGIFTAYVTGLAAGPGADYIRVFRVAGCAAFMGYSLALLQNSIWYKRSWSATFKSGFDGLVYALVTAGTLGWLWPA